MYQALYRKWRPQTFDEVIGQQQVTETLKNQVISGRLSHAYLFIGSRGTGKTTCARILAKAVNCENPVNGNPCGNCRSCRGIADGTVLDIVELDAASNNGVDNVRLLREEAVFSPTAVRKRVYIVDEVHMLSNAAFNALLKILEEPPEHLMFILATTEPQKIPATILSRCQRHRFRRIDTEMLAAYLETVAKQEKLSLTKDAAELIARLAEGGVRDALSLLDQCSTEETIDRDAVYNTMGLAGNIRLAEMLDTILRHDTEGALRLFDAMWMDGKNPASLLGELASLLRDVLMLHVAPKGAKDLLSGGCDVKRLSGFASRMTSEELLAALGTVQNTLAGMRDTQNPKMSVELCLVSLCENAAGDSFASLRARISRLEEELARGVPVRREETPIPQRGESEERGDGYDDDPERPGFDGEPDDDPDDYREEQPEDVFLDRRPVPAPDRTSEAETAPEREAGFRDVLETAMANLPPQIRSSVFDESKLRGFPEGDVLRMEAQAPFFYSQVNRQEVLKCFAEAARRVFGREMRVQLTEMKPQQREPRDVNELRQFPEVHFTESGGQ